MMSALSHRLGRLLCNICYSYWDEFNWAVFRPVFEKLYEFGCCLQCQCVDPVPILEDLINRHRKKQVCYEWEEQVEFYITAAQKKAGSVTKMKGKDLVKLLDLYL